MKRFPLPTRATHACANNGHAARVHRTVLESALETARRRSGVTAHQQQYHPCVLASPQRWAHTASFPPPPARSSLDPVAKYNPKTARHRDVDLVVLGPDGGAFREDIELLVQYAPREGVAGTDLGAAADFIRNFQEHFASKSARYLSAFLGMQIRRVFESSIFSTDGTVAAAIIEVSADDGEPTSPAVRLANASSPPKLFLALSTRVYNVPAASDDLVYKGWWVLKVNGTDEDEARRIMAFLEQCCNRVTLARAVSLKYEKLSRAEAPGRKTNIPSFFYQENLLESVLRPFPEHGLITAAHVFDPHRVENQQGDHIDYTLESLKSFSRYPFVLNGASGTGKTVAALQLAEKIIAFRSREAPKYSSPTSVIGIYVCVGGINDEATLEDRPMQQCKNVKHIVGQVVRAFVEVVNKFNVTVPKRGHDLSGMHLHVVLDEMGRCPRLVRSIVGGYVALCELVRGALAMERTGGGGTQKPLLANLGGLNITTAIVGTGVDRPTSVYECGSIGKPFWRVRVTACPLTLISTHAYCPEQFAASVARDPLLSVLARNFRCAALLTMASHRDQYKPFVRDLSPVAGNLVRHVAEGYMASSWWSKLEKAEQVVHYAALVISLLFTQHPSDRFSGCHLLSEDEISVLVTRLGAVDDRLCWTDNKSALPPITAPVPEGFTPLFTERPDAKRGEALIHPKIRPRAVQERISSSPKQPTDAKDAGAVSSISGAVQKSKLLRFHVPSSIALLALLYFCERVGTYPLGQSISVTLESLTAAAIAALLAVAEAKGVSVPAEMLFSSFGRVDALSCRDLGFETFANSKPLPSVALRAPTAAVSMVASGADNRKSNLIVSAPYLCRASRGLGFGGVVERTSAFAVEVVAAERATQSKIVVHADGLTADVACNFDAGDRSTVDAAALLNYSAQKGYRRVDFKVCITSWRRDGDYTTGGVHRFGVSREVFLFFEELLRNHRYSFSFDDDYIYLSVPTDEAAMRSANVVACARSAILRNLLASRSGKTTASVKDALIMCGPNAARPLIPSGISVSFHERRVLAKPLLKSNADAVKFEHDVLSSDSPMSLAFRVDEEASVPVTCWAFSLPLLLSSTGDGVLPPHNAVGDTDSELFDATVEDGTLRISRAQSARRNFLLLRRE